MAENDPPSLCFQHNYGAARNSWFQEGQYSLDELCLLKLFRTENDPASLFRAMPDRPVSALAGFRLR
jgi:hypothetical protein